MVWSGTQKPLCDEGMQLILCCSFWAWSWDLLEIVSISVHTPGFVGQNLTLNVRLPSQKPWTVCEGEPLWWRHFVWNDTSRAGVSEGPYSGPVNSSS